MDVHLFESNTLPCVCKLFPLVVNHLLQASLLYRTDSGKREKDWEVGGLVC